MIKKMIRSLFVATALTSSWLSADLPQPYTNIRSTSYSPYFFDNAYILGSLITDNSVSTFIDVGSHAGGAARYVAQNYPNVINYSVNLWQNCDYSQKNLFQRFLSNVIQENTASIITPIRMASSEAARALNIIADLVYLGSPANVLSSDIQLWFAHLSSNGTVCGQDWDDPAVETSVSKAASTLGCSVNTNGTFWYIQKGS